MLKIYRAIFVDNDENFHVRYVLANSRKEVSAYYTDTCLRAVPTKIKANEFWNTISETEKTQIISSFLKSLEE